ncbi:MAG: hypothetical protein CMQ24_00795 [Gammaproteobacteria bacterium]|nr:hypothetical protein [Gammaproteobacteria bacterium]
MRYLTVALLAFSVSGCMTYDPYTGEEQVSKATTGAAIGASVAAIIAAIDNNDEDARTRNQRILKAAAAGGAIGGSVGYYMDRQEAKLRNQLVGSGVQVVRDGDHLILVMPSNVTFDTDEYQVRPAFGDVLDSVAIVLTEFDKTLIEVTGHTDSTGSDGYNQLLSEHRADAVADRLREREVSPGRVITRGYGESRPIASNADEDGRQQNRRVELMLVPLTG